jgi:hypothetical protein
VLSRQAARKCTPSATASRPPFSPTADGPLWPLCCRRLDQRALKQQSRQTLHRSAVKPNARSANRRRRAATATPPAPPTRPARRSPGCAHWRPRSSALARGGATGRRRVAAWGDAITTVGRLDASVTLAAILQRGGAIVSAGGYPRALTAKARQGAFATGPLVVAGLKAKSQAGAPLRKTPRADP